MFSKVYGEGTIMVCVRVLLLCEVEGGIELQWYGEVWVTSMMIPKCQIEAPWLGLGLGIWLGVRVV